MFICCATLSTVICRLYLVKTYSYILFKRAEFLWSIFPDKLEVSVSANMSADLVLNYSSNETVVLNGQTVNLAFGSIRLNSGIHKVEHESKYLSPK